MDTFLVKAFKGQRPLENLGEVRRGKHRYDSCLKRDKAEVVEVNRGMLLCFAKENTLGKRKGI